MRFFGNYQGKEDDSIRFYDVKSRKTKFWLIMIYIACFAIALVALYPVFWLVCSSLKNLTEYLSTTQILPKDPDWAGWIKTWNDFGFTKYYINSGIAVAGGVLCAIFFNGLMAYVLAVLKPKGHKIVLALVMWCLLIPPTTSFVALFVNIKKIGLTNSFVPLWLTMGANAYWVILFKNYFESLPKDYIDAARIDGCSDFRIYRSIVMPICKPAWLTLIIIMFQNMWGQTHTAYLYKEAMKTLPYALTQITTGGYIRAGAAQSVGVLMLIVPAVIFVFNQTKILETMASSGIKE